MKTLIHFEKSAGIKKSSLILKKISRILKKVNLDISFPTMVEKLWKNFKI